MTPCKTLRLARAIGLLGLSAILGLLGPSAHAADRWWDGGDFDITAPGDGASAGGVGTWNTTLLNWDQGNGLDHVAWNNDNGDAAILKGTAGTVTLGAPITAGTLTINGAYTIANGGNNLTISGTGTALSSAGAATLSGTGAIIVGANQTWSNTSGTMTVSAPVNTGANLLTLDTKDNKLDVTGKISGNGGLTVNSTYTTAIGPSNSGSPTLSNTNDYTGTTTVNGYIWLNSGGLAALGTDASDIVLNAGGFRLTGTATVTRGLTLTGNCGISKTTGTTTFSGSLSGTGNFIVSGNYSGGPGGTGAVVLSGDNSFSGTASLTSDGTLRLAHVNALKMATLNTTLGARSLLDLTANNLSYVIGGLTGSGNLNLGTALGGGGSGSVSVGNNNQSNTYPGILSGTAGFHKIGTGTQTLTGANVYTGPTTLANGVLSVATINVGDLQTPTINTISGSSTATVSSAAGLVVGQTVSSANVPAGTTIVSIVGTTLTLSTNATATASGIAANIGTAGNLGMTTAAADRLVFDGGTLQFTGSATSDRAFTINAGKTATLDVTSALTLPGATGAATNGALTKIGAGTLTLSGANTYTGLTTVSVGTLRLAAASGSVLAATSAVENNATLEVAGLAEQLGAISGSGGTSVSGSLSAASIVQNSLAIGAGGSVTIRATANATNTANAVPEPGIWVLTGGGLLCWLAVRRCRRKR